ncbi:unnamed protein product [Ilex paraguariensis]|uniref:At1g68980-like TPR repeats domain-containing protein n=1 Tax=Ilex paraguariensis TaxID=185542 RepID=A0ABC8QMZ6_9AQUA
MNKLMTVLSFSFEPKWLKRVCDLVVLIQIEKPDLLQLDLLRKHALSLARAQMPIPASIIIRLMLDKQSLLPIGILATVIIHMVKTEIGTYPASNILVKICDFCQRVTASKSPSANMIQPDTMIFNLVLDACVRFGSSFTGQQIMELTPQVGVVADAHTIVIVARIHEKNGQREELNKFKNHIVHIPMSLFYESLLGLHFKFDDIDAASALILDIYKCWESLPFKQDKMNLQKPCIVPIGSHNLRTGLKLQILPPHMQKDPVLKVESKQELVMVKNIKLVLSNKALAKLIIRHKKCGRIKEFSKLLSSIQNKLGLLGETSFVLDFSGLWFVFFTAYSLLQGKFREPDLRFQLYQKPTVQHLCTSVQPERLCWEGSPHDVFLKKLEIALKNYQVDEAWDAYKDFKNLYGFPGHSVMNKLMIVLSYSSEPKWLKRVCDLVVLIQIEKPDLLQLDLLRKLALSLVSAQMPIPASIIIRLMPDKQSLPLVGILATVILHMVKTEIETYLASNILVEICDFCQRVTASKSLSANMIKLDTMIFNLVLDACVRFGSSFTSHHIMKLMSQVGVVADAHTIVIIARIHEMNG